VVEGARQVLGAVIEARATLFRDRLAKTS
jgi:hypothetical protein